MRDTSLHLVPPPPSLVTRLRHSALTGMRGFADGFSARPRLLDVCSPPLHFHQCINAAHVPVPALACSYAPRAIGSRFLASVDEFGVVSILDTDERPESMLVARFQAHANAAFDVSWHPTDPLLATCSADKRAIVWDLERQVPRAVFVGHRSTIRSVAFDPDCPHQLVTAGRDGAVLFWDTRIASAAGSMRSDSVTEDGGTVTYGPANAIRNAHTPQPPQRRSSRPSGSASANSSGPASSALVTLSQALFVSSTTVASAGMADGCIRLWDVRKLGSYNPREYPVPVAESVDLTWAEFSGSLDAADHQTTTATATATATALGRRKHGLSALTYAPTTGTLYAVGTNSRVVAVDAATLAPLRAFTARGTFAATKYTRAAVDPTGTWLAAGSGTGAAVMWDTRGSLGAASQPVVALAGGHAMEVACVAWSPSTIRARLATAADDGLVRVWVEDRDAADRIRGANAAADGAADGHQEAVGDDLAYKSWAHAVALRGCLDEGWPEAWDEAAHANPVWTASTNAAAAGSEGSSSGKRLPALFSKLSASSSSLSGRRSGRSKYHGDPDESDDEDHDELPRHQAMDPCPPSDDMPMRPVFARMRRMSIFVPASDGDTLLEQPSDVVASPWGENAPASTPTRSPLVDRCPAPLAPSSSSPSSSLRPTPVTVRRKRTLTDYFSSQASENVEPSLQ
ncbi:WD40-repeat-containing domain protein [Blastocladiella britannica]|nr:WD40-repeat-containing domain protein [Blastocladiella britannica]